jgi:hypothetical protein
LARRPFSTLPQERKYLKGRSILSAPFAMGKAFQKDRPEHIAQIGTCLVAWPEIDMQLAILLSILMQADTDATLAVYLTLRRSTGQYNSISEAANVSLDPKGLEYIRAGIKVIKTAEAERNALAHAAWGFSPLIEDGILWVSEADAVHFHVNTLKDIKNRKGIDMEKLAQKMFVYTLKDLVAIENQIDLATKMVWDLKAYASYYVQGRTGDELQHISQQLEARAPMQEVLRQMRDPTPG